MLNHPIMLLINKVRSLKAKILNKLHYFELKHRVVAHFRYACRFLCRKKHPLPGKLIVSLTSFPPRFSVLHLTLKTLLSQSIGADLTILWLYKEDLAKLTPEIKQLIGERFEVRTVERDIRSYKKLLPAIEAFPEAYIVTADDDTYYEADWLWDLVKNHRVGQPEVLGHRGHLIALDAAGEIAPYSSWQWDTSYAEVSPLILLTGVGGILYPPGALASEAMQPDVYMSICPNDDIWFYFMAHKNGFMSRRIIGDFSGYTWGETQGVALFHSNVAGGANDRAMCAMLATFGSPL